MKPVQDSLELTAASAASKASITGSVVTTVSWINSSNFGMWAGIAIGLAGLFVNAYFKNKANKRAEEAHRAYMKSLNRGASRFPEKEEVDE